MSNACIHFSYRYVNKQNNNTNKVNSLMNKPKLYKNTTGDSTAESTSTISMPERVTYSTSSRKMKRSESSWKTLPGKLLSKKPNCKSKPPELNSMNLHPISIILHPPKLFLEYIIRHILN